MALPLTDLVPVTKSIVSLSRSQFLYINSGVVNGMASRFQSSLVLIFRDLKSIQKALGTNSVRGPELESASSGRARKFVERNLQGQELGWEWTGKARWGAMGCEGLKDHESERESL